MPIRELSESEKGLFDAIVGRFESQRESIELFLESVHVRLAGSKRLLDLIHSVRRRVKEPERLRDKLKRKLFLCEEQGAIFDITPDNLYSKITDLAGYRILHLHTRQIQRINSVILDLLAEGQFPLLEGPKANIWDEESRAYFLGIGIETEVNPRLYSSVHYVIESNSRTKFTCEIQVRTLAEEIWGEVDHSFNYPHGTESVPCQEQIKVLARVASSCSRLVDSIFRSHEEFQASKAARDQQIPLPRAQDNGTKAPSE